MNIKELLKIAGVALLVMAVTARVEPVRKIVTGA